MSETKITPSLLTWSQFASALLRMPGHGIPVFSAGKDRSGTATAQQLGWATSRSLGQDSDLNAAWLDSIQESRIQKAKVVVLGVPLDTGAGIRRGAMEGPRGVREALACEPDWKHWLESGQVVDLGDIFVNPHLLHDDMLSASQMEACRDQMYSQVPPVQRALLPVSALSQLREVLEAALAVNPNLKLFVMGGDHSVAWPVAQVLAKKNPATLGILQSDAHTDLLSTRLGVKICFGTWSYHANELIGRGGRMVQLGIRQSGRDQAHWENTTQVKQYWAHEIIRRLAAGDAAGDSLIDELIAHFKARGIQHLYFSNDIDGTDSAWASSTGTPAEDGLTPDFLLRVIERLGEEFNWVGSDIMEVAPPIGDAASSERTCELAARYTVASLGALLHDLPPLKA
jgi:agmatinase